MAVRPRVVVVGAAGTVGSLACQIIEGHPDMELAGALSRSHAGLQLRDVWPRRRAEAVLAHPDYFDSADVDAAVVCVGSERAPYWARRLLDAGVRHVVDVSGAFRLLYKRDREAHYPNSGYDEANLEPLEFVLGLPELYREQVRGARLVAVPGCYAAGAMLALHPLRELVERVVVDAKEGASGAGVGRAPSFQELDGDCRPYKVGRHRHQPEIEQWLGGAVPVTFVPHLLPLDQGALVSCYVSLKRDVSDAELVEMYRPWAAEEEFIHWVSEPPGARDPRDTNDCILHAARTGDGEVVVFAAFDNLWKGAAGQAVQCLNLTLGLQEEDGL